ncbi:MAG: hypothetical protein QM802_21010 [Agriterribacter sp.]
MKQKNKVDSKAGTLKNENSTKMLHVISKSASMLLIAMAGFGTMSFTQDDTSVNSIDTNLSVKKDTNVGSTSSTYAYNACCGVSVGKPGDDTKNALYISLPKASTVTKADKETASNFMAEAKSRSIWSMDVVDAAVKADKEMNFNFQLSNIFPASEISIKADEQMINHFTDEIVLKSLAFNGNNAQEADKVMSDNFIAEHFYIKNVRPSTDMTAKADASMIKSFEKANLPSVSVPSQVAAHGADVEMIGNYQAEVKITETVVAK